MKNVLFVCVENSCRSQMAEGFARKLGKGVIEPYSAGSRPSGIVNADAIKVMQEVGIDISGQKSKGFPDLAVRKFDYLVTMGCEDMCPFYPAAEFKEWQIPDPKGKDLNFFRKVRGAIEEKVKNLISDAITTNTD